MLQSLALRELPNLQELVGSHKHCGLRVLNHTIFYPFTAAQGQAILENTFALNKACTVRVHRRNNNLESPTRLSRLWQTGKVVRKHTSRQSWTYSPLSAEKSDCPLISWSTDQRFCYAIDHQRTTFNVQYVISGQLSTLIKSDFFEAGNFKLFIYRNLTSTNNFERCCLRRRPLTVNL